MYMCCMLFCICFSKYLIYLSLIFPWLASNTRPQEIPNYPFTYGNKQTVYQSKGVVTTTMLEEEMSLDGERKE